MTKCPRQPRKARRKKPHSKRKGGKKINSYYAGGGEYKMPYKGHQWVGHGVERRCALCGKKPKGRK